jgi:hypothetical protein
MNDSGDIVIAIGIGKDSIEQIRELFLIKASNQREVYFLRPQTKQKKDFNTQFEDDIDENNQLQSSRTN